MPYANLKLFKHALFFGWLFTRFANVKNTRARALLTISFLVTCARKYTHTAAFFVFAPKPQLSLVIFLPNRVYERLKTFTKVEK